MTAPPQVLETRSSPAATTGACATATTGSATANVGPSPESAPTGRSPSADRAGDAAGPSVCLPATYATMATAATRGRVIGHEATPQTPRTGSWHSATPERTSTAGLRPVSSPTA